MHYPLHLGVTEAGDGEDGRIKSAIGIGTLLYDGLGDTIRVSLTEDSVYEIPVARALADKAMSLWSDDATAAPEPAHDSLDPYHFVRRETNLLHLGTGVSVGPEQPPAVIVRLADVAKAKEAFQAARLADTPVEGVIVPVPDAAALAQLPSLPGAFAVLEIGAAVDIEALRAAALPTGAVLLRTFTANEAAELTAFSGFSREHGHTLAIAATPESVAALAETLRELGDVRLLFTLTDAAFGTGHALGTYRRLAEALRQIGSRAPLWIRNTPATAVLPKADFLSRLLDASVLTGGLLCDGLGDMVSLETETDPVRALKVAYNVLQGAGARTSKTEFVACPSCGRTLFDLQTTTQRIRAKTGHLKGVKLAIMGCIVNGPGEMADADFGYVGGAPGKINLYVGKQCVQYNIPQAEADDRLIALIREHGKWTEPAPA
jgi:(E)-4-hydroxy-3-methylbut-2-enyl-diphosphate synthase